MALDRKIKEAQRKFDRLKIDLPKKIANICVRFFLEAFKREGWEDTSFKRWRPRIARGKVKRSDMNRNILVKRGTLRRAVNSSTRMATWERIRFEVELPYAKIHNEGFDGNESVRSHTRKIKMPVQVLSRRTGTKTTVKARVSNVEVKAHTRHMKMPKRKYMGHSARLNALIKKLINEEIKRCFK